MSNRYERSMLEAHPAFALAVTPPDLQAKIDAANWPDGLLERVLRLRSSMSAIESWVDQGFPTIEMIEGWVDQQEPLLTSSLNVRQAGWNDNDLIADLCANSPERVGDWDVTVERGPYAMAQFRLQEHAYVMVVEDLRVGLGMVSRSVRNTIIGGERTTVQFMGGWRVRDGFRRLGFSKLLLEGAGPDAGWIGLGTYWYTRLDNSDRPWIDKVTGDMAQRPEGWEAVTDELAATVTHFHDTAQGVPSSRVRPATEADLETCCRLINRTHADLDLFRPYTIDFLAERLDDPTWGPKPSFLLPVYGWDDFVVLTGDTNEIVACAGLWDRGRDVRENWLNRNTGEQFTRSPTGLMDTGYADGHAAAMAELISHFLAETANRGRTEMTAALEFMPEVTAHCGRLDSRQETRALQKMPFTSPELSVEMNITRPYTDLAYW